MIVQQDKSLNFKMNICISNVIRANPTEISNAFVLISQRTINIPLKHCSDVDK